MPAYGPHVARTTIETIYALARLARSSDVVHVHMTAAEGAALLARPLVHAPVVATRHFADPRGSSVLGRAAAPFIERSIAAELSISQYVADALDHPTEVLRNGVATAAPADPEGRVVLVAQRLEPEKQTHEALSAWVASGLGSEGWELHIAGDGSERVALQRAIERLDHDYAIQLLGHRDDLSSLRDRAGIFLATAPREPFGLSVAESMAMGIPVVAARGGGHLETVGQATPQFVYPPGDVAACASLLRRLADDVELRRTTGAAVRRFQRESLNIETHVDRLVEIYVEHGRHFVPSNR